MKTVDVIALILLIVGALNWGLVGVFNFDLVTALFGIGTTAAKTVYALVALSGLYYLICWTKIHCRCASSSCKK